MCLSLKYFVDSDDSPYLNAEVGVLSGRLPIGHQKNRVINQQIGRYLLEAREEGGMTLLGLRQLANAAGVKQPENITHPVGLVRAIQEATNHQPCFRSEISAACRQTDCSWRYECKKLLAEWCR